MNVFDPKEEEMLSPIRTWLAASASIAAAALVLAAPATAVDKECRPFVTDFPRSAAPVVTYEECGDVATPSESLNRMTANDRVHSSDDGGTGGPADRDTPAAQAGTAGGGFDWGSAGNAVAVGVGLLALVAVLGLTRRRKRIAVPLVFVAAASLAAAGIVAAGGDNKGSDVVSPKELTDAGWLCVDVPDNWVHCVPPGVDLEANPPESMLNLNFYTHDRQATQARFLGVEDLIRADVWNALPRRWPCGKNGDYGFVPAEALPPHGYMYCHHFKEPNSPAPPLD